MKLFDIITERLQKTELKPIRDAVVNVIDDLEQAKSVEEIRKTLNFSLQPFSIEIISRNFSVGEELPERAQYGIGGGQYTEDGKIYIEILPNVVDVIKTPKGQQKFINALLSLVSHELTHKEQTKRASKYFEPKTIKKYKSLDDWQQYLADPQEIGAHAQQIIYELENQYFSRQEILNALQSNNFNILNKSPEYKKYYLAFKDFDPFKVLNKLRKIIVQLLT